MKDVVIVGGGLAGLAAAWRLRHFDIQVLESSTRVGGRIQSETRGRYVMNWGGHMFAGPGSATDQLLSETGTESAKIPGSLQGMAMNDTFLSSGPVQTYPLRIPMTWQARRAVMMRGARLGLDVLRYTRAVRTRAGESNEVRQQRIYDFDNDRTFADYIGHLPPDAQSFFHPVVMRSAADPDQLSAGAGIGYFSLIWNIGQGLGRSIVGGSSTLTCGIAQAIHPHLELGTLVEEVVAHTDHVVVRYTDVATSRSREVKARTAILATPAPVTHRMAVNVSDDLRAALAQVVYGPLVAGAFLTDEVEAMPYDDTYGIAVANKSFTVALNQGNLVRGRETRRSPGGSMMTFAPASTGAVLLDRDNDDIAQMHVDDLDALFPGFSNHVVEARVEKFILGAPYCFPGRRKLQSVLTRPEPRVFLAGDYLGTLYTETSIASGFSAAQHARSLLANTAPARR